ncbi:MAG: tetratricopeptide repeat protein [Fluviicola sp.]|nr:tetratricopeptide repeat protein [Fluviicola sp.]
MKTAALLLIFVCSTLFVHAQNIQKEWNNFRNGSSSERIRAAKELATYYISENKDSLRVIGEDLFFYGIDEHYYPAIENGKLILAEYYVSTGKTTEGISTVKALISNIQERGDEEQMSNASRIISQGYRVEKDAKSALYWANKSVEHAKNTIQPETQIRGLISLAEAHYLAKDTPKAISTYLDYVQKANKIKNNRGLSSAYARLGDIYRIKGDLKKAEEYFQLSMNKAKQAKLNTPLGHAINNLAIIHFEKGDTLKARQLFEEGLNLRLKANDLQSISESYYNLGDYQFYIGKIDLARKWYFKSFEFAKTNNLKNEQKDALKALVELSKSIGDYEAATSYLEQCLTINEQLKIQQESDDSELMQLQMELYKLEVQSGITKNDTSESTFFSKLRWEWFVIGLLILVLLVILKRKGK